jgi:hypothetical protein
MYYRKKFRIAIPQMSEICDLAMANVMLRRSASQSGRIYPAIPVAWNFN